MTQTRSSKEPEILVSNAASEWSKRVDRTIQHQKPVSTVTPTRSTTYGSTITQKASYGASEIRSRTDVLDQEALHWNPDLPLPSIERTASVLSSPHVSSPKDTRLRTPSFTFTPPPSDQARTLATSITSLSPDPQRAATLGDLSCQLGSLSVGDEEQGISSKDDSRLMDGIPSTRPSVLPVASTSAMTGRSNSADSIAAGVSDLALRETPPARGNTSSSVLLDPFNTGGVEKERAKSPRRKSHDRRRSSTADVQTRHNVSDEPPPKNEFHQPAFQSAITQTEGLVATIAKLIESSNLHNEKDSSMGKLFALTSELTKYKPASSRVVGLVGDSGAGKLFAQHTRSRL